HIAAARTHVHLTISLGIGSQPWVYVTSISALVQWTGRRRVRYRTRYEAGSSTSPLYFTSSTDTTGQAGRSTRPGLSAHRTTVDVVRLIAWPTMARISSEASSSRSCTCPSSSPSNGGTLSRSASCCAVASGSIGAPYLWVRVRLWITTSPAAVGESPLLGFDWV